MERIETSPAERQAIAAAYGLVAVNALSATLAIGRPTPNLVTLDGRVEARIVQTCVVTLAAIEQVIDERFNVRFARGADPNSVAAQSGTEAPVGLDDDPPEPLSGHEVDLGAVVLEHFAVAIDPYPRAPGAELPAEAADPDDVGDESPFAALAQLRSGKR